MEGRKEEIVGGRNRKEGRKEGRYLTARAEKEGTGQKKGEGKEGRSAAW